MPSNTFYNLPEEKRDKILKVIKDEFIRVKYSEISINQIIQKAEISRGSFYQYFDDKEDMLSYILLDYQSLLFSYIRESLIISKGDIFRLFEDIFQFAVDFVKEESTFYFLKNVFADINNNVGLLSKHSKNEVLTKLMNQIVPFADMSLIQIIDEQDLANLVEILSMVTRDAIVEACIDSENYSRIKMEFQSKIKLLKRGFAIEKENVNVRT